MRQQPDLVNSEWQIKQAILSMKAALSDLKKARVMVEEQIARLEKEKC